MHVNTGKFASSLLNPSGTGTLGDVGPHDDLSYTGSDAPSSDSKVSDLALLLSILSSIVLMLKD